MFPPCLRVKIPEKIGPRHNLKGRFRFALLLAEDENIYVCYKSVIKAP